MASASSTFGSGYAPSGAINGDRTRASWGSGGGWNDATPNAFPDWLEVDFGGTKTISEVDVFSVQDNYQAPSAPTPTMTFSLNGLTDFQVQYWTGTQWLTVPGGFVSGNNLVWRQVTFPAVATSSVRDLCHERAEHLEPHRGNRGVSGGSELDAPDGESDCADQRGHVYRAGDGPAGGNGER